MPVEFEHSGAGPAIRHAVEPQRVRLISMRALAPDVFVADLGAVLDDVNQGHRVPTAQAVILLQPIDDDAGLDVGLVVPFFLRQFDELVGRLACLCFNVVEVCLE